LRYDIAISYATEDSGYVDQIANLLKENQVKVFFDKYEEANLWGKDLYSHLSDVYSKWARFCLMVVSKDYAKKQWTNVERKAAQSHAMSENVEYILPLRIDDTEISGLMPTVGYLDIRKAGVEKVVHLLIQKLKSE
jgi:hypothetical protein